MNRRATAIAALALVIGLASAGQSQQMSRRALYDTWQAHYKSLEGDGCRAKETEYIEALKFAFAYYQVRLATAPAPAPDELQPLSNAVQIAQKKANDCLRINTASSAGFREGELPTADSPSGASSRSASGVSEMVPLRRPNPVPPAPPADVATGADPAELQRLQAERDALVNNLAAAEKQIADGQGALSVAQSRIADLAPVAESPDGIWEITMRLGADTTSARFALMADKLLGFMLQPMEGDADFDAPTRDDRGNWVFTATEDGKRVTMRIDLSRVATLRTITGTVSAGDLTASFVGYKLGDRRLAQPR